MIAGLLGSGHPFMNGIDLEQLDREHSVRLNVSAPELRFCRLPAVCNLDPALLDYTPPVESRHGSGLRAVSTRDDFSQER